MHPMARQVRHWRKEVHEVEVDTYVACRASPARGAARLAAAIVRVTVLPGVTATAFCRVEGQCEEGKRLEQAAAKRLQGHGQTSASPWSRLQMKRIKSSKPE